MKYAKVGTQLSGAALGFIVDGPAGAIIGWNFGGYAYDKREQRNAEKAKTQHSEELKHMLDKEFNHMDARQIKLRDLIH